MKLRKLLTGLLLLTLSLGSCSGAGTPPSDSTSETERKDETSHKPESVTLNTDYTVVYPSRNTAALDAAQIVRDVFSPLSLPIRSDAEEAADREILIGNTNRPETAEAKRRLADGDAIVTVVGEKLVLYATADRHYASLVEYLAQELQGSLTLPADLAVKSTLDTVRTLLSEETVGSASTTVSVTLYGEDQNAEVGILVGNDLRGQGAFGYYGYCATVTASAVNLYRLGDASELLATRKINGLTDGHPVRLQLESDGAQLRIYLPDETDPADPWPIIEVPVSVSEGNAIGLISLSDASFTYESLTVSYGDLPDKETTYRNPIYLTYADPDVLYYNGLYYLYATGGEGGYRVHTSEDLVHWTDRGICAHFGLFGKTRWFWAPDVEEINGRFYMVTSCDETLGIAVADSPLGPFKGVTEESLYVKSIDGHIFVDTDGRIYLYFVSWRKTYGIYGVELDPETMLPRPETETLIIKPTEPWEKDRGSVTEGPYLLKHNGLYYMTYSGSHYQSPDYAIGYAVSDSPLGTYQKYENNPIMIGNAFVSGVGHHCIVTDKDGEMWVVYHCHKAPGTVQPRNVCIDRIRFLPDPNGGIDRLEAYGPTVTPQ